MKLLSIFLSILFSCISCLGQTHEKESYLILRLNEKYDQTNKNSYFYISADSYNDYAKEIYDLVPFNKEPYENNSGISFFFKKTDSSDFFYNYFRSQTEALKFLSRKQWQLLSVISEINSGYEKERVGENYVSYTTVSSRPIYYFIKIVN